VIGLQSTVAADFAPRALLRRRRIRVGLSPWELHRLIRSLEERAREAADEPDGVDYADYLFRRVAQLREAAR
jgi:hypothetical protein